MSLPVSVSMFLCWWQIHYHWQVYGGT